MKLPVAEIFPSISGEVGGNVRMGERCVFLRVSGCNLRCDWCDTPATHTSEGGTPTEVEQVIEDVTGTLLEYGADCLVLTGGEPLLYIEELYEVIKGVTDKVPGVKIQIETNGTKCIPSGWRYYGVSVIADYKPPSAGCSNYDYREELFSGLTENDVVKIVVKTTQDLQTAFEFIQSGVVNSRAYIALSVNDPEMAELSLKCLNEEIKRPNTGINCQIHKFLELA